ncbi:FimV N-terminal domain-containing protein, partial [Legionella israelensis DSM 19235]
MKITILPVALFTLVHPVGLSALGLGDMIVHSYLNQPFEGEISLQDLSDTNLSDIKATSASQDDYERVGIEQTYTVALLNFKVSKNNKGKPVIKISSSERITDPYFQLLIDVAWSEGQLYREYTVLLDPPGYQIGHTSFQAGKTVSYKKSDARFNEQTGVVDKRVISQVVHSYSPDEKREKSTYGPVKGKDENIWQIAQRFDASQVNLQQVVLAIVGMNPEAFTDGNLNGLKSGTLLTIPSTATMSKVPASLARQEVQAHDEAWKNKSDIKHVLLPPYTTGEVAPTRTVENTTSQSVDSNNIPSSHIQDVPKFSESNSKSEGLFSTVMSATSMFVPEEHTTTETASGKEDTLRKSEIAVAATAVESVREANTVLKEQLQELQSQNKQLQKQINQREKEIAALRQRINILMKQREAVSSQASSNKTESSDTWFLWPLWLLFVVIAGGAVLILWYFRYREPRNQPDRGGNLSDDRIKKELSVDVEIKEMPIDEKTGKAAIKTSDSVILTDVKSSEKEKQSLEEAQTSVEKQIISPEPEPEPEPEP